MGGSLHFQKVTPYFQQYILSVQKDRLQVALRMQWLGIRIAYRILGDSIPFSFETTNNLSATTPYEVKTGVFRSLSERARRSVAVYTDTDEGSAAASKS